MPRFWLIFALMSAAYAQPPQPLRLTLSEAQRIAIQNNPQYASAKFTAAASYQVPPQYRAALLPNLYGSLTTVGADSGSRLAAGALNNPSVYDRAASGLSISQLLTDFGRTSNLIGMAKLQAQAQDQNSANTRAVILLATSTEYFAVLRAQALLKVAQQTVAARQVVVNQVTALAQSNLKSTLDVSFANVNLADAKLMQAQAENDLHAAEAQLATAMGLPNQTSFDLSEEPMPAALPDQVEPMIADAMQNRPDLRALQLQEGAAERFTKAEHDLFYPSIGLIGTAGVAPAAEPQISGRYGAVGLNITIPLFNGGLYHAREAEAAMKAKAAGQDVTELGNRITRDVRVAYLNANTAYQKLGLTQQLLDQAQLALNLAQSRYDLGLSSIVELSQAQLNLTSAQIANTSAKYDYQAQRINLDYQTGVLR
jgi:outer membrane protein